MKLLQTTENCRIEPSVGLPTSRLESSAAMKENATQEAVVAHSCWHSLVVATVSRTPGSRGGSWHVLLEM